VADRELDAGSVVVGASEWDSVAQPLAALYRRLKLRRLKLRRLKLRRLKLRMEVVLVCL